MWLTIKTNTFPRTPYQMFFMFRFWNKRNFPLCPSIVAFDMLIWKARLSRCITCTGRSTRGQYLSSIFTNIFCYFHNDLSSIFTNIFCIFYNYLNFTFGVISFLFSQIFMWIYRTIYRTQNATLKAKLAMLPIYAKYQIWGKESNNIKLEFFCVM